MPAKELGVAQHLADLVGQLARLSCVPSSLLLGRGLGDSVLPGPPTHVAPH